MANVNAPFGLKPLKRRDGQAYSGALGTYPIASATAANIGTGDIVKRTGTGNYITLGTNGTAACIGVFLGVKYRDSRGNVQYLPNWVTGTVTFNSEDAQALVIDDAEILYALQFNSTGFAAVDVGQFAGVTFGTPDANGNSIAVGDGADITGTADNVKINKLSNIPVAGRAANAYGAYAIAEVLLGIHENRGNPSAT